MLGRARPGQIDGNDRYDPTRSRAHHGDGIGQEHRFGYGVGHEERRRHPLGPYPQQFEVEPLAGHLVQRAERLVEEQDPRLGHQRPGDRHPLAHPAGELVGPGLLESLQTDQIDQVLDRVV